MGSVEFREAFGQCRLLTVGAELCSPLYCIRKHGLSSIIFLHRCAMKTRPIPLTHAWSLMSHIGSLWKEQGRLLRKSYATDVRGGKGCLGRVLAWLLPLSLEITADAYTLCVSSQCTVCGIFLNQSHPHMLMCASFLHPAAENTVIPGLRAHSTHWRFGLTLWIRKLFMEMQMLPEICILDHYFIRDW